MDEREARYAEAVWGKANANAVVAAVMAVADAEQAALAAEVERLRAAEAEVRDLRAAMTALADDPVPCACGDNEASVRVADLRALASVGRTEPEGAGDYGTPIQFDDNDPPPGPESGKCCASGRCEVCSPGFVW